MALEPLSGPLTCGLFMKWAIQRLMGQQVTLNELPYILRLSTDSVNFWYAYVDFNANDDFDSNEFLSLFVYLLFTTQNAK